MAIKDMVIIGQALGDAGTRGYVAALDGETGEERWRFYVVPGPGEPGHETWPADTDAWMTGGGGVWVASTYDPQTNRLFVGTGNPAPAWDAEFRPGDNLYTASTVVLDADTGAIDWYHQYSPNDGQERDEISPHLLFDVNINGEQRQALGHFSRTGYYFTFDRNNGTFLNAEPVQSEITWTDGIDPKTGKPVEYDSSKLLQEYKINLRRGEPETSFCGGAFITGIWPPAYDPERQRVYNSSIDTCIGVTVEPILPVVAGEERFGVVGLAGGFRIRNHTPLLTAIDAKTGKIVTDTDIGIMSQSGVMATAGGLVFLGMANGAVEARDSDSLERLWSTNVGTIFKAAPISYAVDGKQYIAIIGGAGPGAFFTDMPEIAEMRNTSMLWVFAL